MFGNAFKHYNWLNSFIQNVCSKENGSKVLISITGTWSIWLGAPQPGVPRKYQVREPNLMIHWPNPFNQFQFYTLFLGGRMKVLHRTGSKWNLHKCKQSIEMICTIDSSSSASVSQLDQPTYLDKFSVTKSYQWGVDGRNAKVDLMFTKESSCRPFWSFLRASWTPEHLIPLNEENTYYNHIPSLVTTLQWIRDKCWTQYIQGGMCNCALCNEHWQCWNELFPDYDIMLHNADKWCEYYIGNTQHPPQPM